MQRTLYSVIGAFENEDIIRNFVLKEANSICLSREGWSYHRGDVPTNFIKTPVNVHYGLDSDPRFIHVVKTLENDLIKRENGNYFYYLSDYTISLFNRETLFSETDAGEYAFHEHFYGFHDVILFYHDDLLRAAISTGTGDALLNLTEREKKELENEGLSFELPYL